MPKAKAAAQKAVQLDDTLAEAHEALAAVLFWYDYDWPGAENEFRRALELNPNLGEAYEFYGWYQTCAGSREEGVAVGRKAVAMDPLSINALEILSQDPWFLTFLNTAPELDFLRSESRFQDLVRKMNFSH